MKVKCTVQNYWNLGGNILLIWLGEIKAYHLFSIFPMQNIKSMTNGSAYYQNQDNQ